MTFHLTRLHLITKSQIFTYHRFQADVIQSNGIESLSPMTEISSTFNDFSMAKVNRLRLRDFPTLIFMCVEYLSYVGRNDPNHPTENRITANCFENVGSNDKYVCGLDLIKFN